jgi:hypothetical protein
MENHRQKNRREPNVNQTPEYIAHLHTTRYPFCVHQQPWRTIDRKTDVNPTSIKHLNTSHTFTQTGILFVSINSRKETASVLQRHIGCLIRTAGEAARPAMGAQHFSATTWLTT